MEYAPGPSMATTALVRTDVTRWNSCWPRVSQSTANSTRQHSDEQYGVRKPRHKHIESRTRPAIAQSGVASVQCAVHSTRSPVATERRRSRRAAPGIPVGNMENSLCTAGRLFHTKSGNNPDRVAAGLSFSRVTGAGHKAILGRLSTFEGTFNDRERR
jgi:hypothetical protein